MNLPGTSKYIYGSHEPMPRDVMPAGWILFLAEVGDNPEPHPGKDFGEWEAQGYGILCRIQYRWGYQAGTLPRADKLDAYVQRVRTLVQNSKFCHRWIIGNEPNVRWEWPGGQVLTPQYVATCYNRCWTAIHDLPGHELDEVIVPPIGPWNIDAGMGWIDYFVAMLDACQQVDALAIHAYSHGADPGLITSNTTMQPPYEDQYYNFRVYRNWLEAVPEQWRAVPAYLTETDQNGPWLDEQNGWIPAMYREVDQWNQSGGQTILCACLYRWPNYDPFGIDGKANVIADWQTAQAEGYTWTDTTEPPEEDDMLKNPSFELPYHEAPGLQTVKVADGWQYFASSGAPPLAGGSSGPCQLPEYKPLPKSQDPRRVIDGDTSQCWFIRWKVMDGGVYQRVEAEVGASYHFDVAAQAWCSNSDDPTVSDGELYVSLGIDPYGGTDAFAQSVAWTEWAYIGAEYKRLESHKALAGAGYVTLFIRAANKWALSHNDVYIDDAHLTKAGGGTEPPVGEVDYERIRQIVREEIDRTVWASGAA